MTVSLTVSETIGGAAFSDQLAGGGHGVDMGASSNNSYTPLISKSANTGHQDLYIIHDAVTDPITDLKSFIQQYGSGTGASYGGAATAAGDYTTMVALGNASGGSKNNADGLSGGLWIDMQWDSGNSSRFDQANFPGQVKIYGAGGTLGKDLAGAYQMGAGTMVWNNTGTEAVASAPVAGKVGKSGDHVLGDICHAKLRAYLPASYSSGGLLMFELVLAYSFTG